MGAGGKLKRVVGQSIMGMENYPRNQIPPTGVRSRGLRALAVFPIRKEEYFPSLASGKLKSRKRPLVERPPATNLNSSTICKHLRVARRLVTRRK